MPQATGLSESSDYCVEKHTMLARHPVYQDYAYKDVEWVRQRLAIDEQYGRRLSNGHREMFPVKLQAAIDACSSAPSLCTIIRWLSHGRAFKIYDKQRFIDVVLPEYFEKQSAYGSFQRQLNMYGFLKLTGQNDDNGAFYHPLFLRGRPLLSHLLVRKDEADCKVRRRFDAWSQPNFHCMPPVCDAPSMTYTRAEARSGCHSLCTGESSFAHEQRYSSPCLAPQCIDQTTLSPKGSMMDAMPPSATSDSYRYAAAFSTATITTFKAANQAQTWHSHCGALHPQTFRSSSSVTSEINEPLLDTNALYQVDETCLDDGATHQHFTNLQVDEENLDVDSKGSLRTPHGGEATNSHGSTSASDSPAHLDKRCKHVRFQSQPSCQEPGAIPALDKHHQFILKLSDRCLDESDDDKVIYNVGILMTLADATAPCDRDVYAALFATNTEQVQCCGALKRKM